MKKGTNNKIKIVGCAMRYNVQYSILWIININKKHGCARECANRLYRVCTNSSSVDDGE